MHSHRRSRGKILFEAFCAVCVGVSFVGAWIQTGAWAFLVPAFVFTLFGLYWSLDMVGSRDPLVAAEPAVAAPAAAAAGWAEAEPARVPDIRFERFEALAEPVPEPFAEPIAEPEPEMDAVPFAPVPEPVAEAKPKRRAKKAAKPAEPVIAEVAVPEPVAEEPHHEAVHHAAHIEQLFEPQPFVRQARPAFGKRNRGPGPRPLPA